MYEPDRAQGLVYSLREGRTLPFKLSDSPGLPGDILRPGIQVHFFTAPDESGGQAAVQLSLEAVASLGARLRHVARRASRRAKLAGEASHSDSEVTEAASSAALDDIAFMGAGVSQVSTKGRRGLGGSRRERDRMPEDHDRDGPRPKQRAAVSARDEATSEGEAAEVVPSEGETSEGESSESLSSEGLEVSDTSGPSETEPIRDVEEQVETPVDEPQSSPR